MGGTRHIERAFQQWVVGRTESESSFNVSTRDRTESMRINRMTYFESTSEGVHQASKEE